MRRALVVLALAALPAPRMPHPAPNTRATTGATCETCHTAIATEWRSSLHHTSFTDKDIQHALGIEPDPFCVGCHAPETDKSVGVACVTCHVPSGDAILAVPGTAAAPHPVLRTARFATDAACATCHEFDFPDAKNRTRPLAMQRTVSEHAGRNDTCATCHMPKRNGHADHRFLAARDDAFVKSAVTVSARRDGNDAEITLTPASVGHAFPTGDLFRRVRVTVGGTNRFLARHYVNRQELPGIVVRSEVSDDRVQGGPRVVRLPIAPEATRVQVVYERAEGVTDTAHIAGSVVLLDAQL